MCGQSSSWHSTKLIASGFLGSENISAEQRQLQKTSYVFGMNNDGSGGFPLVMGRLTRYLSSGKGMILLSKKHRFKCPRICDTSYWHCSAAGLPPEAKVMAFANAKRPCTVEFVGFSLARHVTNAN